MAIRQPLYQTWHKPTRDKPAWPKRGSIRSLLRVMAMLICAIPFLSATGCWQRRQPDQTQAEQDQKAQEQRERDEKTREEVAKATERLKPDIQKAGKALEHGAEVAAEEAHATAQGVKEGWERGGHASVNLNSATESELIMLPGITRRDAARIINSRPYRNVRELVARGIISEEKYAEIRDHVVVK